MELDDLRRRWEEQDRKLETTQRLSTHLVQQAVVGKAETAMIRLTRLLGVEIAIDSLAVLWLGSFLGDHGAEMRFALPAAALLAGFVVILVAGIRQLAAIGAIDYSAPVVAIQRRLEKLRIERIRATAWTLILAPLAWVPVLIVAVKGLLGVDLYANVTMAWLISNVVFGMAVVAAAIGISRRYADRMERSPFAQSLMRDLAGHSLTRAREFLRSLDRLEAGENVAGRP